MLAYFDQDAETVVISDASPVGLGAILTQKQHNSDQYRVVCYASRALSDVERRYSQTEREALGIVWDCEHFFMYLYGISFIIVTDHKPLEFIFNWKMSGTVCARVERWSLHLKNFMKVGYFTNFCPTNRLWSKAIRVTVGKNQKERLTILPCANMTGTLSL